MNFMVEAVAIFIAVALGLRVLSFIVEAFRPAPEAPAPA